MKFLCVVEERSRYLYIYISHTFSSFRSDKFDSQVNNSSQWQQVKWTKTLNSRDRRRDRTSFALDFSVSWHWLQIRDFLLYPSFVYGSISYFGIIILAFLTWLRHFVIGRIGAFVCRSIFWSPSFICGSKTYYFGILYYFTSPKSRKRTRLLLLRLEASAFPTKPTMENKWEKTRSRHYRHRVPTEQGVNNSGLDRVRKVLKLRPKEGKRAQMDSR